ncbi:retron system putative HNH endonuclease [Microbulbifer sp. MKSA007]|nr:retron system putative HNH endonuclease [Microbulbifer sp. MKSA007]
MRAIKKGVEPKLFTNWKALANDDWIPTYSDLSGNEKKAVKDALIKEQGGICCYCERRLVETDSHIEHCKPQESDDVDPLDFSNMICSCLNNIKKGAPSHCGDLKGNWYDDQLFVSPLNPDCEGRFSFGANGSIDPTNPSDRAANETITRLGLGIPKFNALREKALEPFLDEDLSPDDLAGFVSGYLARGEDGTLSEFVSAVESVFSEWVAA